MKFMKKLAHAAIVFACLGMVTPRAAFSAGPTAERVSHDVTLSSGGSLSGVLVTSEGKPLDGAVVTVRRGDKEVGKTVANAQGKFSVAGLSGGAYELIVGSQVVPVRAWTTDAAPPSAKDEALIVVGNATRGQAFGLDIITLWTLTASTGAVVLGALNQSDINDLQDKVDQLLQSP